MPNIGLQERLGPALALLLCMLNQRTLLPSSLTTAAHRGGDDTVTEQFTLSV
jgi:hypothetical protein